MPVYEYRCARGHEYEKVEGFDAPTEHACPHCGGSARRRLSVPAVIFKGSGFYSTDNRKSSRSGNGSASSGETSDSTAAAVSGHSHDDGESKAKTAAE